MSNRISSSPESPSPEDTVGDGPGPDGVTAPTRPTGAVGSPDGTSLPRRSPADDAAVTPRRRSWLPRGLRTADASRLVGIDMARGLAILGMFVVHVGVGWTDADGASTLTELVAGRSAATFALLAGVSVALLSGGSAPKSGHDMGVALWRVVIRGLIMLPIGTLLTMTGVPVSVILAYYAVFFVLCAPLMDERWKIVAGTAALLAVIGPVISFYLRGLMEPGGPLDGPVETINSYDPLVAWADDGLVNFLITGSYPAITWMPFVLAGLAIGRLNLRSPRVQLALVGVGASLAAAAYTASWALMRLLDVRSRLEASFDAESAGTDTLGEALREGLPGTVPVNDWTWLLTAAPHSGTPFEVVGAGGVAIAVLGLFLLVGRYLRWVLFPLAAVGALALTTYVGHVLLIWVAELGLLQGTPLQPVTDALDWSVLLGALVFATLWRALVGRGPLEGPLHVVSMWVARRIP
ncbi:heparan-alpha-glucosaminide N-acetyltransferase domain-containing protein [Nocardiopsis rhodophaea]|uniref:heparan-alpha-glucosaminide N-acetyltransferase domain-containing protein n=1 Tax=Nocardiopsis rhodophaea TaxID=280238 RepID=UPI0031D8AB46